MTRAGAQPSSSTERPSPVLTIVIPTRNERANVAPLLDALTAAIRDLHAEVVVVDDSEDDTAEALRRRADDLPFTLRTDTRSPGDPRRGLSAAVLRGFALACGEYICVMDADLQHPPAFASVLLEAAQRENADVVIASRYVRGGHAGGLSGRLRRTVSRGSSLLARALFPAAVGSVRDPMSGFFVVRRSLLSGVTLRPLGYKILLEILVRCRPRVVRELPYQMAPRRAGRSKAGLREGVTFLRHLARLRLET